MKKGGGCTIRLGYEALMVRRSITLLDSFPNTIQVCKKSHSEKQTPPLQPAFSIEETLYVLALRTLGFVIVVVHI